MSFIAGYLAGLEESGSYKNEAVTLKSNGEYKPGEGVRWDKVTVDVPQESSGIMKIIDGLPVRGSMGLKDGYRIDFSFDTEDAVPVQEVRSRWSYWYPNGGGDITIYPDWRGTALMCYAKVYRDGELLLAMGSTTNGFEYSKQRFYFASEGQAMFMSSEEFISDIHSMTVNVRMPDARSSAQVILEYKYKKNCIYYNTDGSYSSSYADDKSDMVYFNDISAYSSFPSMITELDLNGKAKALIGLHVAFIHTMGYDIKYDISNI